VAPEVFKVYPAHPHKRVIDKAVQLLANDGVVIYPTDTVYGLGASIYSKKGLDRIYRIKKISNHKLLSFIVPDFKSIARYAHVSNYAYKVLKRCLPGPFTFILPATNLVPKKLFQKRKTVGIRIPDNKLCMELVIALNNPIISTSVPAGPDEILNNPEEIIKRFGNEIDLVMDGGLLISQPSTIVDLTGMEAEVIRRGSGDVSLIY
jgi:tRNA threonylcarbamoyl adenosine modification protein (Sua5/YciO/YrdC/YwlC family)